MPASRPSKILLISDTVILRGCQHSVPKLAVCFSWNGHNHSANAKLLSAGTSQLQISAQRLIRARQVSSEEASFAERAGAWRDGKSRVEGPSNNS